MLHHKIAFDVPLDLANARVGVVNWLQGIGYKLATPPFLTDLAFERGSGFGNATAVNPQKWRSKVTATFRTPEEGRTRVEVEWNVVTAGQMVTKFDIAYWRSEVAGTQAAAEGRMPNLAEFERERQKASNAYLVRIVALTTVTVAPLLVSIFTRGNTVPLYVLTAVLGLGMYFAFRAPRRL